MQKVYCCLRRRSIAINVNPKLSGIVIQSNYAFGLLQLGKTSAVYPILEKMVRIKRFCQTVAASAIATAVVIAPSVNPLGSQAVTISTIPSVSLPDLTGPYQVGKTSYDLVDSSRPEIYSTNTTDKRELIVYIWYPSSAVPGATRAPYLEDALVQALATQFQQQGLSPDLINIFSSVQTHASLKTPISTAQASYPVVLFSPGFGGLPENYSSLAEELASHGYIVASISHTYDANVTVFPDGRSVQQAPILAGESSLDQESVNRLDQEDVNIRAADARFVLNELQRLNADDSQNLFTGHLDLNRIGIFGHSLGGNTVATAMLLDSRFKAGLNLDGNRLLNATLLGRWVIGKEGKNSLARPLMLVNAEVPIIPEEQLLPSLKLKSDLYNLSIRGTKHGDFETDIAVIIQRISAYSPQLANQLKAYFGDVFGSIDANRGAQIIDNYTLAFFDRYLKSQNSPLLNSSSSSNYPEIQSSSRLVTGSVGDRPTSSIIAKRLGKTNGDSCQIH